MNKVILGLSALATMFYFSASAQEGFVLQDKPSAQCSQYMCDSINGPSYTKDGAIIRPIGWEKWVFIGSPLTPDELNNGKAPFREFHNVYIEPSAFDHYRNTGEFPNGTQIVKVRTLLYEGKSCSERNKKNGACRAVSGWGYFNGEYSGFELAVKDKTRFKDPGGWVYLKFGEERPWDQTAKPFEAASCNACHAASAADDYVFTQFYPVLRDNDPKRKIRTGVEPKKMKRTEVVPMRQLSAVKSPVPIDEAKLFKYLQKGEYKKFATKETKKHPTAGPHLEAGDLVRVYFSDAVAKSLKGDYDTHPKGSALIKELFSKDGKKLVGWAVSVKTDEKSDNGKGWFWVEYTSTTDMSKKPVSAGNGVGLCVGCHLPGKDFVLSSLPE